MTDQKYPRIKGSRRKPNSKMEGSKGYGKPCIVCGTWTCGEKFVQVNWFRGDDDVIRVCSNHWKLADSELLKAYIGATP